MKHIKSCIAVGLLVIVSVGCKNDKSTDANTSGQESAEPEIQVVADIIIKEDDVLELFYTEDKELDFGPKRRRVEVKGSDKSQQVVFNLPDDAHIINLRFDVGQNPDQKEIIINKFIVKQHDRELELGAADFFSNFDYNHYVKTFPEKFMVKTSPVDNTYDPVFCGNGAFIASLRSFHEPQAQAQ
ncbi:hypothetical protein [uncultured Flavobacterium sp.]|uniref:hypothetical protein n=1 Tax=uncultured Flavobacterium sp. TaxID=165435 RepID=UPI0025D42677|nr:hypothetical protein [uncultured Flavobacterium sp.]